MDKEEYRKQFTEDDAVGWLSIDAELDKIYSNQEPQHFGPIIKYMLGGEDPLDGISVYESDAQELHYHFVSYGLSELYYDEEKAGGEFSKFGFELTFRLKNENGEDFHWAMNLMQNLAKYVFKSGKWFEEFHFIPANGPIKLESATYITALAFVEDPELGKINTPHGEVTFLQMVGLTTGEYDKLKENPKMAETEKLIEKLKEQNRLLITDLGRK